LSERRKSNEKSLYKFLNVRNAENYSRTKEQIKLFKNGRTEKSFFFPNKEHSAYI